LITCRVVGLQKGRLVGWLIESTDKIKRTKILDDI
jgi:hypothetical protein